MDLPVILVMQHTKQDRDYHIQGGVTMTSITYIGMDVHTTNYTLCAYSMEGQKAFAQTTINPDIDELLKYLANLKVRMMGQDVHFVCGYEAT